MLVSVVDHVSYLREHSTGSILRSSFKIYRENFRTLFLIYSLPALPFLVAQQEAQVAESPLLILLTVLANLFVGLLAFAAITVAISDTCIGERPGVIRSYRRLRGPAIRRLAWANVLQVALMFAGMVLFVIPGLIVILRLMFTPIVATLENVRGRAALKRSAALAKGFNWRNVGVFAVLIGLFMILGVVVAIVSGVVAVFVDPESVAIAAFLTRTFFGLLLLTMYPLFFAAITLMYYDLRVRKEAYDLNTLAEDLRR